MKGGLDIEQSLAYVITSQGFGTVLVSAERDPEPVTFTSYSINQQHDSYDPSADYADYTQYGCPPPPPGWVEVSTGNSHCRMWMPPAKAKEWQMKNSFWGCVVYGLNKLFGSW